jgi:hypothetical protein
LLTVATEGLELTQLADDVTSCVDLSDKVAVAMRLTVLPLVRFAPELVQPMEPEPQLIAIEVVTLVATVRIVLALRFPEATLIVVVHRFTAVARPLLSMVATVGEEELQVAVLLMSFVVRSPKVPVAVNCCVLGVPEELCSVMAGLAGEREMAARSCPLTKNLPQLSAVASMSSARSVRPIRKRFTIVDPSGAAIQKVYQKAAAILG